MPNPANKPTIAVDIDDVIVAESEFIVGYSNKHWGHALSLEDYDEHWSQMWGVDHDETERRADILHSLGITSAYRVLEDAHDALNKLSRNFRLIILTSRRKKISDETLNWLEKNFSDLFEEVHFTGFWDEPTEGSHLLTKGELSKQIGADYMIDDQVKHCVAAAEAGVKCVLFGEYAHAQNADIPDGVTRCKNWKEVLEYFQNEPAG